MDEPQTAKGYRSDFDLLIIVNNAKLLDLAEYWANAEDRLNRELAITQTLHTLVNFIVATLGEVTTGLSQGRYFLMDIARDGIALYQSDDAEFLEPKPKTPEQALAMAREYYGEWFASAAVYLNTSRDLMRQGRLKEAAFLLHQAPERYHNCVLLVCTFYSPHVHNLGFLRTQAEWLDIRLIYACPRDHKYERTRFEKLKEAYVKARYSRHYTVTEEELSWLGNRVKELGQTVETICNERIATLERASSASGSGINTAVSA